ncbi:unnamed protein product [Effrenium voratum]|uniref:Uncharacterized protein n=1 Tax=Effrenium voratum TaxID=2562239 RepID=A0AA36JN32_9DINO|nr:unnamed protein product [Effrenium voratum]
MVSVNSSTFFSTHFVIKFIILASRSWVLPEAFDTRETAHRALTSVRAVPGSSTAPGTGAGASEAGAGSPPRLRAAFISARVKASVTPLGLLPQALPQGQVAPTLFLGAYWAMAMKGVFQGPRLLDPDSEARNCALKTRMPAQLLLHAQTSQTRAYFHVLQSYQMIKQSNMAMPLERTMHTIYLNIRVATTILT